MILSFAYQISSKRYHSRQSYVPAIYKTLKNCDHLELEIHPGFGFSNSIRVAIFKSISSQYVTPSRPPLTYHCISFVSTPGDESACQI